MLLSRVRESMTSRRKSQSGPGFMRRINCSSISGSSSRSDASESYPSPGSKCRFFGRVEEALSLSLGVLRVMGVCIAPSPPLLPAGEENVVMRGTSLALDDEIPEGLVIFEAGVDGGWAAAFDALPEGFRFLNRIFGTMEGEAAEAALFEPVEMLGVGEPAVGVEGVWEFWLFWDALSVPVLNFSLIMVKLAQSPN